MKNEEDISSDKTGNQTQEKSTDCNKGKSSWEKNCAVGPEIHHPNSRVMDVCGKGASEWRGGWAREEKGN